MGNHNHPEPASPCKHELGYCDKCDVAYCKLCTQEWVRVSKRDPLDGLQKSQPFPRGPYYGNPNVTLCAHYDARGINVPSPHHETPGQRII